MKRDLVLFWNEKAVEVLNYHFNPGSDARRMAIIQIGIHDALNSVKKRFEHYCFSEPQKPQASSEAAVNAAAFKLLTWAINDAKSYEEKIIAEGGRLPFSYNSDQHLINLGNWYQQQTSLQIGSQNRIIEGEAIGNKAAEAIIQNRQNDGHENVTFFSATPADGTIPGQFRANYYSMGPILGLKNKLMKDFGTLVKPFAIVSADQFSRYINALNINVAEIQEVELKGTRAYYLANLSPSEKQITDKWNNLKQHVVWNNFAVEIINNQNPSFDAWDTARVLALIHTAMADGTISMFKDIYTYYRWRPITAINPNPMSGGWECYSATPRVPEYPSTFGILGGATGKILTEEFTDQINIVFQSIPYTSIDQAVKDNTESKLYLGWNFRSTFQPSIEMGKEIGEFVYQNSFKVVTNPVPI